MDEVDIDTVVVGAGVVGLATAREMAQRGKSVVILEAMDKIGAGISERNSGVIHAGLYYRPGSWKAKLCIEGRDMLYAFARTRNVWHQQCGKLVVATSDAQTGDLHTLKQNAETNGVTDMRLLSPVEAKQIEPEIACAAALHVPVSGTVDVHEFLKALLNDAENNGAVLQLQTRLARAEIRKDGFKVFVEGANEFIINCRQLVNAAGLQAQKVASLVQGYNHALIPQQILGKGTYFSMHGKAPFRHLIYPLPQPGTSGLHYRLERDGRGILGPDLEIIDIIDYKPDPARAKLFYEAVRLYYPALRLEDLQPDYAGVRPKLTGAHPDFVFQTEMEHGIPGLLHCYGIESPGVTASMAIGKLVATELTQ